MQRLVRERAQRSERPDMTGNSEKLSHLPVEHFLVYRETQHNSVTHKENLREIQNIVRRPRSHQQVFTKCWKTLELRTFKNASHAVARVLEETPWPLEKIPRYARKTL